MRKPRIYVSRVLLPNTQIELQTKDKHYITRVLRLKIGDPLILFNGQGGEYCARLSGIARHNIQIEVLSHQDRESESEISISLALAILKSDPMDYALQKAVELGVQEIIPLYTEHTVACPNLQRTNQRLAHWHAVVVAASQQCGRNRIPLVTKISALSELFSHATQTKIFLDLEGKNGLRQLSPATESILVVIGPEGGFGLEERVQCERHGFIGVYLGSRVLRAETASVAVLSAIQVLWGDMGSR